MDSRIDAERMKAVIDLQEYIETLGVDRPRMSEFLKGLGISPQTMSDAIRNAATAVNVAIPECQIEIINFIFKMGVTVGYKYAVAKEMQKTFDPMDDITPSGGNSSDDV